MPGSARLPAAWPGTGSTRAGRCPGTPRWAGPLPRWATRRGGWGEARGLDLPQALAVISEAVWWVTMVDATVVRYYPDAYDRVLAALDPLSVKLA